MIRSLSLFVLTGAVALLIGLSTASAQPQKGQGGKGKGDFGKFIEERFKALDKNSNGKVSVAEYKEGMKEQIARIREKAGDKADAFIERMEASAKAFAEAVGTSEGMDLEQYTEFTRKQFQRGGKGGKGAPPKDA